MLNINPGLDSVQEKMVRLTGVDCSFFLAGTIIFVQASCGQDNSVAGRRLGWDKNAGRACVSNFGPRATLL